MSRRWSVGLAVLCVSGLAAGCTTDSSSPQHQDLPNSQANAPSSTLPPINPKPGGAGGGDPYYPDDGNGGYDVARYELNLSYDPAARFLRSTATITATATQDLSRFNLDLHGLHVRSVTVDSEPAGILRDGAHELVITPSEPLRKGTRFRVRVRYDGVPSTVHDTAFGDNGWTVSASGGAFTAGEPHSASTWYPVNDHPGDKATFRLAARVPDQWGVVSNGVPVSKWSEGGWTTYGWASKYPMAPYLTTIGIDKWRYVERKLADGTPVLEAYAPGAEGFKVYEDRLPEVLNFLSSKFGKYPMESAGAIVLGQDIGYSLETQTRPTYTKGVDLATIVHENTHQWFGDAVSVAHWKDICLNECFAAYAEDLWAEAKQGANLDALYRSRLATTDWSGKLYDMGAGNEFSAVYTKGKLAMHALRRQLGDATFFRVLRGWVSAHRGGNASWPQFERYASNVSGQDLGGFFQAWFHSSTQPPPEYLYPGGLAR
jgi:aminopeptidase N